MKSIFRSSRSLVAWISLACPLISYAQGFGWSKVTSGKLELYTPSDPNNATDLLRTFARMRYFFSQYAPFAFSDDPRLLIIAFQSEKEFAQYRLNAGSCAFYQQTSKGEYVVLQDLMPEHRDVSAHEFTHFVVAHSGLKLPLWLNEGIADLYSTLDVSSDEVVLGKAVPMRINILHKHPWLSLPNLFEVGTTSEYYSDPTKMFVFYSESWALTHMLALSPEYSQHFPEFLRAISSGESAADSFKSIYKKKPGQVEGDVRNYVNQSHLPSTTQHVKFGPSTEGRLQIAAGSSSDVDLALSDMSLSNPNSRADIQSRLVTVASRNPDDSRAEEALGSMAMRQGNVAEARAHFHKAIERHSADASVYFYAAYYDRQAGSSADQTLPLLRQALELKPDYYDARLELALLGASNQDYEMALDSLNRLGTPHPEHGYTIAYSLAYCYAKTDKLTEARRYAAEAKSLAKSENERAEVVSLAAFIEEQAQYVSESAENKPVTRP